MDMLCLQNENIEIEEKNHDGIREKLEGGNQEWI